MKRTLLPLLIGLSGLLLFSHAVAAQTTNVGPRILFVHLRFESNQISLVTASSRPGVLKRQGEAGAGSVVCEVVSKIGGALWTAPIPDPSVRVVEYEEPPGSGVLKRRAIPLTQSEFTIRVPAMVEARQLNFYRLESAGTDANGRMVLSKTSLGNVVLP